MCGYKGKSTGCPADDENVTCLNSEVEIDVFPATRTQCIDVFMTKPNHLLSAVCASLDKQ